MILKKHSLASAYSGFQCCLSPHTSAYATSTSPTALPIPRARPAPSDHKKQRHTSTQYRCYATVKNSKSYDFRDNMNWPCCHSQTSPLKPDSKPSSLPTPYDIFDIHKTEVYTKHKFYQLVKIYHPDSQSHHDPTSAVQRLHPLERLHRYRLVVQAHTILSDPSRRKAYDATGAGWGEAPSLTRRDGAGRPYSQYDEDSPFGNATWEDWDKWYARTSPNSGHQRPSPQAYEGLYMNPNAFASFVILIAIISGILQATNAGSYAGSIEERAQAFTAETQKFVTDRKVKNTEYTTGGFSGHNFGGNSVGLGLAVGPGSSDHRIRHFLERRDPSRSGLKDEEEDAYRRHFSVGQQEALALLPQKGMVTERPETSSESGKND